MGVSRFLRSSVFLLLQQGIGVVLSLLLPLYLARTVTSATLGSYFLFVSLQSVLGLFAMLGIGAGIIKFVSEGDKPPGTYVGGGIVVVSVTTTLLFLGIFAFQGWIDSYIGHPVWAILAGGLPLMVAANLFSTVLIGENRIPLNALTTLVGQLIAVPTQILVASHGFLPLVMAYNLQFAVVFFLVVLLKDTDIRIPDLETIRVVGRYGAYAVISNVEERAFQWTDLFVIGLFLTKSATGIYGVVWSVSKVGFMPTKAIGTSLLPKVSELDGEETGDELADVLSLSIFVSGAFVLPLLGGALLVGEELLAIVFTPEYASAWFVLVIALLGRFFHSIHRVSRNALLALNLPRITFRIGVASITVNVILNAVMVPKWGLLGAATATTLAITFSSVPFLRHVVRQSTGPIVPVKDLAQALLATLTMMVYVHFLTAVLPVQNLASLAFVIGSSGVLYFWTLGAINEQVKTSTQRTLRQVLRSVRSYQHRQ